MLQDLLGCVRGCDRLGNGSHFTLWKYRLQIAWLERRPIFVSKDCLYDEGRCTCTWRRDYHRGELLHAEQVRCDAMIEEYPSSFVGLQVHLRHIGRRLVL